MIEKLGGYLSAGVLVASTVGALARDSWSAVVLAVAALGAFVWVNRNDRLSAKVEALSDRVHRLGNRIGV